MKKRIKLFEDFKPNDGLPKEIRDKVEAWLKKSPSPKLYWDQSDDMPMSAVRALIAGEDDALDEFYDSCIDMAYDAEVNHIKDALEAHGKEIAAWLGEEVDDIEFKDLANDYRDDFLDSFSVDYNLEQLARNTGNVPCRVVWKSNFEGLQSDFDNGRSGGYKYEDYFKQMLDLLNMNPRKVAEALGQDPKGFPDKKVRDGNEFVSYDHLVTELRNNSSYCEFVIACMVDPVDLVKNVGKGKFPRKFTVPKGNECGLFSSWVGGGSTLEMKLLKDFPVDLDKKGETQYDHFELVVDADSKDYSIKRVYGLTNAFFGKPIKVTSVVKSTNESKLELVSDRGTKNSGNKKISISIDSDTLEKDAKAFFGNRYTKLSNTKNGKHWIYNIGSTDYDNFLEYLNSKK